MNTTSVGPDRIKIEFGDCEKLGVTNCFLCPTPLLAGEVSYLLGTPSMEKPLGIHAFCYVHLVMTFKQMVEEYGLPDITTKELAN